jgi:hypothetical protein
VSEQQLVLAPTEPAVGLELVDGAIADELADAVVIAAPAPSGSEQRNLFGEAERIAARAASARTRRQYASIFRAFGDWLAGELGRPPAGREREVPVPLAVQQALEAWLKVHPSPAASGCWTSSPCSSGWGATDMKSLSPCPPSPCIASCGAAARPLACRSGSATRMRCVPTGLRTVSRPACPCTPSLPGSATLTCGPPPGMPPHTPEQIYEIADVLDRRHQAARRGGGVV